MRGVRTGRALGWARDGDAGRDKVGWRGIAKDNSERRVASGRAACEADEDGVSMKTVSGAAAVQSAASAAGGARAGWLAAARHRSRGG